MLFLNLAPAEPDPETDVDVEVTSDEEVMLDPPFRILIHNDDVTNPVRVITFSAVLPLAALDVDVAFRLGCESLRQ